MIDRNTNPKQPLRPHTEPWHLLQRGRWAGWLRTSEAGKLCAKCTRTLAKAEGRDSV